MDPSAAFKPAAPTIAISLPTVTPPTGVQLAGPNSGDVSVWVYNPGPNLAWLAYGNTAADAQTNAVAPAAGTPQNAIAIAPAVMPRCYTFNAKTFFSGLAITGTQLVYLAPGQGI